MTKDANLSLWEAHEDIDPKFTKQITGRDYGGTSPNPQYVIKCLTSMFGPVGQGFGWRVLAEAFQPLGDTILHWCRIEFWHTDRANVYEAYGQTKAAYTTSGGKYRVDEDAPKKSLTDAIVKAASQLGVAANIFLGRWDDQKYVAEVNAEFRAEERATEKPQFSARAAADRVLKKISKAPTLADLGAAWKTEADTLAEIKAASAPIFAEVETAKNKRKADLALADSADVGGDAIPY